MRYQFTQDLVTGNNTIDSEHKTLIKAADDMMLSISSGKGKDELEATVKFLGNYAVTHFKHEEELQEKSKYPGMAAHKAWHVKFLKELGETSAKIMKEGASSILVIELTKKMSVLIDHIKTEDKKLAMHINNA